MLPCRPEQGRTNYIGDIKEINILDIRNNAIYTRDDYIIMALKINSINIQLFSKRELNQKVKEISNKMADELKNTVKKPVDFSDTKLYENHLLDFELDFKYV